MFVLSIPLWVPWLLRPAAGLVGATLGEYQRLSYDRIVLQDLRWSSQTATARLERIESPLFWGWLKARAGIISPTSNAFVQAEEWALEIHPSPAPGAPNPQQDSVAELLDLLSRQWNTLHAWIPSFHARKGSITVHDHSVPVPEVAWGPDGLHARTGTSPPLPPAALHLQRAQAHGLRLDLSVPDRDLALRAAFLPEGQNWRIDVDLQWHANRVGVDASFSPAAWSPTWAELTATNLALPPSLLATHDLEAFSGSVTALWTNDIHTFALDLHARKPIDLPWLDNTATASLKGHGTATSVTLDHLELNAPPLGITLARPATLHLASPEQASIAEFSLLYPMPPPHQGRLTGTIRAKPRSNAPPSLRFELESGPLQAGPVSLASLNLQGRLDWPWITLEPSRLELTNRTALTLEGGAHLGQRTLTNLQVRLAGALPESFLPKPLDLEGLTASLQVRGTWPQLRHQARIRSEHLSSPGFQAEMLELESQGEGTALTNWNLRFLASGTPVNMTGTARADWDPLGFTLGLDHLRAGEEDLAWVELTEPVTLTVARNNTNQNLHLTLSPLRASVANQDAAPGWVGVEAELDWPVQGRFGVSAERVEGGVADRFVRSGLDRLLLEDLDLRGGWTNGPLVTAMKGMATYDFPGQELLGLLLSGTLDGDGLQVRELNLMQDEAVVATLEGAIPVAVHPSDPHPWKVAESDPISLSGRVVNGEPIWRLAQELADLRLEVPRLDLSVTGSVDRATALLSFQAESIYWEPTNAPSGLPAVTNVHVRIQAGRHALQIEKGDLDLLGQTIHFYGYYAILADSWGQWLERLQAPDWTRLAAGIRMDKAPMEALAPLAPDLLLPVGSMAVNGVLHPDLQWEALLTVTNVTLQPIDPFGSVRDIHTRLRLAGRKALLENFRAELGGQPIHATGQAEWHPGHPPAFDAHLTGTNLSLVRTPEIFLRSDVDIRLLGETNGPVTLTGNVNLRDSLLFQDFRSFLTFDLNQPERRPPYFSVQVDPLKDWKLDLQVRGDRFLRIISPAFHGHLSTGLHLEGDLEHPIAVGQVSVPEGRVIFPFGTLDLDQARVTLTEQNPYRPSLNIRGTGRTFGYLVRIEVSGFADDPVLTFSSVPPLTPKEILLMLTAGEIPQSRITFSTADKVGRLGVYMSKELLGLFFTPSSTSERLVFRSGEQVTDDGRPTYSIEYRLSDRWSAIGEYNRFRDFNSGLKYKIFSQ